MPEEQRRASDRSLTAALALLMPWQRAVLFLVGTIAFLVPILDHVINEVIRGDEAPLTLIHIGGDAVFLFAGILGMVPQLAIRVIDHLAVWRNTKKP